MSAASSPALYRVFDANGRLIYIGATSNLSQRLTHHRSQAWWWSLARRITDEPHPDMDAAHEAEWAAIAAEVPAFNLARKRGRPTSRPHWLSEDDAQVVRDWLGARGRGGLPEPLRWITNPWQKRPVAP